MEYSYAKDYFELFLQILVHIFLYKDCFGNISQCIPIKEFAEEQIAWETLLEEKVVSERL